MPPTLDESKLNNLIHSESNSSSSLYSWAYENDIETFIPLHGQENAEEKFDQILEKASVAFPKKATLETMIRESAGVGESSTAEIQSLKLQVIGRDVSLQHIPLYAPKLTQLVLDGSVLNSLRDLGSGLKNMKYLSVNSCGLNSLDGIMALVTLEELHVAGNKLRDLSGCVSLTGVKRINGKSNSIQDIAKISLLSFCEKLEWLDIEDNPFIEDNADYLLQIKEFLPQLKKLDGIHIFPSSKQRNMRHSANSKESIKGEWSLPSIEVPPDKTMATRPHSTTLPYCTYAVKFPPKPLSPRASSARNLNSKDIESKRLELPKL